MEVYFDNAATTKVAKEVVDAMIPFYTENYGNASSSHKWGQKAEEALEDSRKRIAECLNARAEEIIFTGSGSESNNFALKGIARANKEKGNHIITSKIEHSATLESCKSLEGEGFSVTYLDVDKEGFVDLEDLKREITDKTILVSIMHVNNEIGTIEPIDKIGEICKENGVYFHVDAAQSFMKVPIDVKKINADLISLSAHKIHGPKGVGALFIKSGTDIRRFVDGGSQEMRKRAGTENVPGIVGFAKATELIKGEDIKHMAKLRDKLISFLEKIPDSRLNGPKGDNRVCNNVNYIFKFIEGESIMSLLDMKGIAVSTGSACNSDNLSPSHVLSALGLPHEIIHGSIRFSFSRENTEKEVDYLMKVLPDVIKKLRNISPYSRENQNV